MKHYTGALTNEEVLQRLGMNEQELEKEALLILEASEEEFAAMIAPRKDVIERIAKRMMTPDEMIEAATRQYLRQPGN
jgi:hypothetical protein